MSAAKHTAGPWTRDRYGHVVSANGQHVLFRSVTIAASGSEERLAIAEANTDLATAAPELLEALQALRLAREQDKYRSWERGVPKFNEAEALADAAIAKATGGGAA